MTRIDLILEKTEKMSKDRTESEITESAKNSGKLRLRIQRRERKPRFTISKEGIFDEIWNMLFTGKTEHL